jgi:hypothetical protein
MVAFGRIVQYQALVVWFSALAFWLALQWKATRQNRFAFLSGLCLGTGLLAHYDAILVSPAIAWLFISAHQPASPHMLRSKAAVMKTFFKTAAGFPKVKAGFLGLIAFFSVSLLFYLPYALDPQANRTGDYVANRIGAELRNNLPDFFHFNTFYSSAYYLIVTSLLIVGLLSWILWRARWGNSWMSLLAIIVLLVATFRSHLFTIPGQAIDLTILPFALVLAAVFLALPLGSMSQALLAWLAVPFLGYNFIVALGLTHIYTIVPPWALLAALGWRRLVDVSGRYLARRWPVQLMYVLLSGGLLLSALFLWNSFVRHDIEYWQDYPTGNIWFYWNPYQELPKAGFFGFAHRAGWKAIGHKIAVGELDGDYGSNEEPDVTTWYTRGAPRACDPRPEFYFLADDVIDQVEISADLIATNYVKIGTIRLSNQKQLHIMQQAPAPLRLASLDEPSLAREFDRTATPAAFARSARGSQPIAANFGNLVQLIGYDLDTRRAEPGGRVPVTLYWQALAKMQTSYQIFTHLEGGSGPVAQADGVPVCWTYATDTWRPGQIIADQHAILLPVDIPPGQYPLEVGLYLPATLERLDLIDIAGNPAGTSLTLTLVEIKNQAAQVHN